jgi:hypothetical protein
VVLAEKFAGRAARPTESAIWTLPRACLDMRARTHTHTHTRLLKRNLVAGSTATLARPRHSIALRPISKLASVLQGDGGPGKALDQGALDGVGGQEPSSPTRPMIPMRSATTSSSAAFAPSSRQDRTARRSATTSGFTVSATASSGRSATSRSTAPSPHDMINSPIASLECYISEPRVTGSNLSTRPKRQLSASGWASFQSTV